MSEDILLVETRERIRTLTLNRPAVMNALSRDLRKALADAFADVSQDDEVDVVILTGTGRAFCAGLDLAELEQKGLAGVGLGPAGDVVAQMNAVQQPIIGAVNGFAVTGGLELALACDFLLASSNARFADTHVRVGVLPGWGMSQKLPRLIGVSRAKEMSFSGRLVSAGEALDWGLVNRVVAPEELMPQCEALAREISLANRPTLLEVKALIDEGWQRTLGEGLALESETADAHRDQLDLEAFSERRHRTQSLNRGQL